MKTVRCFLPDIGTRVHNLVLRRRQFKLSTILKPKIFVYLTKCQEIVMTKKITKFEYSASV